MEEQDRKDKETLKKIAIGVGIFLVIGFVLWGLQRKPPEKLTCAEVTARVEEILAETEPEAVEADGVQMEQYVASNRDMLYITEREDGTALYEFTCKKTQLIYVYVTDSPKNYSAEEMEVYDVEEYLQQMPKKEVK